MQDYRLEPAQIKTIEKLLAAGKIVEVKMERGKPVLIAITRKIAKEEE